MVISASPWVWLQVKDCLEHPHKLTGAAESPPARWGFGRTRHSCVGDPSPVIPAASPNSHGNKDLHTRQYTLENTEKSGSSLIPIELNHLPEMKLM